MRKSWGKKQRIGFYLGNLAFGGRGPAYLMCNGKRKDYSESHDPGYGNSDREFDSTKGFHGEGWQKLKIAAWNCRSLTFERFEFCKSLKYDILALTELWNNQGKFQNRTKQLIVSKPKN